MSLVARRQTQTQTHTHTHTQRRTRSESPLRRRSGAPGLGLALALVVLCAAAGPARADQRDPRLDPLFAELASPASAAGAGRLVSEIFLIWDRAPSRELDVWMEQGVRAMQQKEFLPAMEVFSRIIQASPDFAAPWYKRAEVHYRLRNPEASMRDLLEVLEREPRHFEALKWMGLIYMEQGAESPALRWFERALEINPHQDDVSRWVDRLRARLSLGEI